MKILYNIIRKKDFIFINIEHYGDNAYESKEFKRYTTLKFGRTYNGIYKYKVIKEYLTRSDLEDVIYLIKRGYGIQYILKQLSGLNK